MKNKNKMLMVLGLMLFLANGDNYAAASLISNIASDLNLTVSAATLSVTAYMMAFGAFTLVFGPLSDRFGKVNVINTAAFGTAIFSMLGALSFNLPSLMFFRAMNGVFGAGIFPVALALIGETFDDENRQHALGKAMGLAFLGAASASAIGGALAYFGSWRLVYLTYGIGELILAFFMTRLLQRDQPSTNGLNLFAAYRTVLTNHRFMRLAGIIFIVGFTVFGSFTYTGILIQESAALNILIVGLILSIFGIGTVMGGRIGPHLRNKTKHAFLILTGLIGATALFVLSTNVNLLMYALGLLGFGIAFILLQSTLVATVQEKLPHIRGTVMAVAGFNLFLGGSLGTIVNAWVMKTHGTAQIFHNASFIFLGGSLLAALFVARFEMRKRNAAALHPAN